MPDPQTDIWDEVLNDPAPPAPRSRAGGPCGHPGCLSHVTHPCEGCGRVAGEQPGFDGKTYDPALDRARLGRQLGRVFEALRDGAWRTLRELAHIADAPEASVSARIRDLRKPRFGAYTVEHRRRGDKRAGIWEYRLLAKGPVVAAISQPTKE